MRYQLLARITHPEWEGEVLKRMTFEGPTRDDILDKLECPEEHRMNLRHHGRAGFKDARGAKHRWEFVKIEDADS